jgi:hypothetical protein
MIDFTPPFKRISMLDGLKEAIGMELPGGATNLGSDETNKYLLDLVRQPPMPPSALSVPVDDYVHQRVELVGTQRELETPLPSNSPHDHMILRVDLVGSHGRWKRPCLQTAHMTI